MTSWHWNGARWWKFDFHAHTPASDDYGKGPNQGALKNRAPKEWLLDYMRAGIDCVAITDHNSGLWVDKLKQAYGNLKSKPHANFRPLCLFPGVEISVNGGVHLCAIFGPETSTSGIDSLLGAVGYRGTKGSSDTVTDNSFSEVVTKIEQAGGLAIPAHVDNPNGLFKEFQGTTLKKALECDEIVAMEVVKSSFPKPQLYLDGKLKWTEILASDAHHPDGSEDARYAGSHFTWIKMGAPSLEGLRLALLDGSLSVRRSDELAEDPNRHAPLVIESIEISQARYMGRSQPFHLELNPWLNAIIGGRGTGKSTVIEFLRLDLRREKELPQALQEDFSKYHKVYNSRDDDGLLTEDSSLAVIYRKNGKRYRVQWSQRGDAEPIEVNGQNGLWEAELGDITQRFPVRIYSQKQIFELARAPLALLRIIDDAPDVDRRSWVERWKEEETRFLSLRSRAREIEAGLAEEPRLRGELEDIKHKLEVFEQAGHAAVLKQYQKRLRQQRAVEEWEKTWVNAAERLRNFALDILPDFLDPNLFNQEKREDKDLLEKAAVPVSGINKVKEKLETFARELDDATSKWKAVRDQSEWKRAVNAAVDEYGRLRERLAQEGAGDPSAYGELVQRRQLLEGRLKELESRKKQLDSVRKEAEENLGHSLKVRRELTNRRREFLEKVLRTNPYVRIEVVPYGARETVEPEFRSLIQREGGGFEKDIGSVDEDSGLVGKLYSGTTDAGVIEKRLADLKQKVKTIALGKTDTGEIRDQRFVAHLAKLPPEAFDRLDMWFPEDSLHVQYSTPADGAGFRSIQEGSPGQKTAALLAFLLSYGEEPIVLDQPEDDLDNHLIYDLIVTQLRNIKQSRQVIVVTHNANIVVNGDAELVVGFVARTGETHQECTGSLQEREVRANICAVMEGGREAFERRYRRISLEAGHV